jgi:hypothetical protein
VPATETGSAISFNQVLRTIGFSAGSALCGVVLAAYTPAGHGLPTGDGYRTAALFGVAVLTVTIVVSGVRVSARRRLRPPIRSVSRT